MSCPIWQLCDGQIGPIDRYRALLAQSHRHLAGLVTVGALSTALAARRAGLAEWRSLPLSSVPAWSFQAALSPSPGERQRVHRERQHESQRRQCAGSGKLSPHERRWPRQNRARGFTQEVTQEVLDPRRDRTPARQKTERVRNRVRCSDALCTASRRNRLGA